MTLEPSLLIGEVSLTKNHCTKEIDDPYPTLGVGLCVSCFQKVSASTKTECDYLHGWIKKPSHTQKSHPKMVNPRDGNAEEENLSKILYVSGMDLFG